MFKQNTTDKNFVADQNFDVMKENMSDKKAIIHDSMRYPYCIVWTPIPLIT